MKRLLVLALLVCQRSLSGQAQSPTPVQEPRPIGQPRENQALLAGLATESRRSAGKAPNPDLVRSALQATLGPERSFESDERFVSERGGATFTWEIPERYDDSWRAWRSLRTVDVEEPTDHKEKVYGYAPSFVHPDQWPLTLDGCRTKSPDNASLRFSWTVRRNGALVRGFDGVGCIIRFSVPQVGAYEVTMEVQSQKGWRDSLTATVDVNDLVIVSLGDSSASGEGNPDDAGLDTDWIDRRCHRSMTSGHALTAEAIERRSPRSSVTYLTFACSGAELGTGLLKKYSGQAPMTATNPIPSIDWQVRDLDAQVRAAREALCSVPLERCGPENVRRPDFLFVAVGVNDLGFVDVVTACGNLKLEIQDLLIPLAVWRRFLGGDSCDGNDTLERAMGEGLISIASEFEPNCGPDGIVGCFYGQLNFAELRRRLVEAGIFPTKGVYLTTYPAEPFSASSGDVEGGCGVFRFIDRDEAKFMSAWGYRLNDLIHREAIRNGFFSVSGITAAFRTHGYCAGQVLTLPFAGSDGQPVMVGSASYFVGLTDSIVRQLNIDGTIHPNRAGHEALRDAILASIAAKKPDRQPTHRLTILVDRIRFDLPQYPDINGALEFFLTPSEIIKNSEVKTNGSFEQVTWKRALQNRDQKIIPGQWQTLSDPLRLGVDIAPTDQLVRFAAGATVQMKGGPEGGVLERQRSQDANEAPGGDLTSPKAGKTGFYGLDFVARRGDSKGTFGTGIYRRRGKVDNGPNNPGSMSVEFCVMFNPINPHPGPRPTEETMLSCSGQHPTVH